MPKWPADLAQAAFLTIVLTVSWLMTAWTAIGRSATPAVLASTIASFSSSFAVSSASRFLESSFRNRLHRIRCSVHHLLLSSVKHCGAGEPFRSLATLHDPGMPGSDTSPRRAACRGVPPLTPRRRSTRLSRRCLAATGSHAPR